MNFFHDPTRNLSVYRTQSDILRQAIPEAKLIQLPAMNGSPAAGALAIPHTLRNAQVLRRFGYPVAPVITDANYAWPRVPGLTPYQSQKIAANFMVSHPRCFNLSDMGVGKTLAALWAADFLMRQHPKNTFRALIVCPLSIMQRVWSDAIFKNFLGTRSFEILHGTPDRRLQALAKAADFYIINFDGVGIGAHTRKRFDIDGFSKALRDRDDIRLVIVDEASAYKDGTTKRHRIAREVIGRRDYLWLMTGTPTPNAPTDAYGLAKMVNNAWGKSFRTFQDETMMKVSQFIWKPRKDGYDKARQLMTPAVRFAIGDVWDGPEMTTQVREVALTASQKKLMADLKRDLTVVVKSGHAISAVNEAAARQKFIQISLGAIYDENHKWHAVDAKPRMDELKAVIREAPGKMLIFSPLTSIVNLLYRELKEWSRAIVNGDVSQKERSGIFRAFQEDINPRLLIADPGTMAHGLDLWQARTVVWFGPTDKTELYLQANKRAHRPGQKFPVTVVQLVSNKLEQEIFRRLETNTSLQGALLDAIRQGTI